MRAARFLAISALMLLSISGAWGQQGVVRVVYHFVDGLEQASRGLEYIRNHVEVDAKAEIVVVAHAGGVDFLLSSAKTARGNEFRGMVEDLDLAGVKFRVCEITLRERGLQRNQFVKEAGFVASGVAEIARLQSTGFAYIRP